MQSLNEVIDFYLKIGTNYALMITGEWGIGKTYFFKNILKKQISETPTFENDQKNYRPVLVSLFGLKSIEDIQTEIFLSLYPILKNKSIKLGSRIGKSLLKGIMQLKNLGNYYDFVSDVEIENGDWIKFNELVICFDDLERLSGNLSIEEFIGYVNALVENDNVKVLIVANENKIERENYFALKEKVVGSSIEFIPDMNETFDSIIESKFDSYPVYLNFLKENKDFILGLFTKNSSNFRILIFALTYFHFVYSEISVRLKPNSVLKSKEIEILLKLLKFSIVVSIEYKLGKLSFSNRENLDGVDKLDWSKISIESIHFGNTNENVNVEDKTFKEKFIELYYLNDVFNYFNSIYVFITGGAILVVDEVLKELAAFYHIEENVIPPQYEILNTLGSQLVFELSDKEYNKLTRRMIMYAESGSYGILNYISVFYLAARFDNPLRYNLDKLEKRIITGMKKGIHNYKYIEQIDFHLMINENSELKDSLFRIRIAIIELNEKIFESNSKIEYLVLEKKCYENFRNFSNEVFNANNPYFYSPIFESFNVTKFYRLFLKNDNSIRWEIVKFWKIRYKNYSSNQLKREVEFLVKLNIKIRKKLSLLPVNGLTHFVFSEHSIILQKSIDKLNSLN